MNRHTHTRAHCSKCSYYISCIISQDKTPRAILNKYICIRIYYVLDSINIYIHSNTFILYTYCVRIFRIFARAVWAREGVGGVNKSAMEWGNRSTSNLIYTIPMVKPYEYDFSLWYIILYAHCARNIICTWKEGEKILAHVIFNNMSDNRRPMRSYHKLSIRTRVQTFM